MPPGNVKVVDMQVAPEKLSIVYNEAEVFDRTSQFFFTQLLIWVNLKLHQKFLLDLPKEFVMKLFLEFLQRLSLVLLQMYNLEYLPAITPHLCRHYKGFLLTHL